MGLRFGCATGKSLDALRASIFAVKLQALQRHLGRAAAIAIRPGQPSSGLERRRSRGE
jgi:hypothetical protein